MISNLEIYGAWRLVDFIEEEKEGARAPWGEEMRGLLFYDPSGRMSVSITKKIEGESSDAQAVLNAILFYAGRFRVEGDQIAHEVEVASAPSRVGKTLTRNATLREGVLELSSTESWGRAVLRWRKIG
jgi:hypothetical protein